LRRSPSKKDIRRRSIRVNDEIRAPQVRVLDDQNKQVGLMSSYEALVEARKRGIDLVEIAPKAVPPVVKLIELNKYLYLLAKKEKNESHGKTEVKEIKLGLFVAENDATRLALRAKEFLEKNHQVKLSLWLKGRQLELKQEARAFLTRFIAQVGIAKTVSEPVMQGKVLRVIITQQK